MAPSHTASTAAGELRFEHDDCQQPMFRQMWCRCIAWAVLELMHVTSALQVMLLWLHLTGTCCAAALVPGLDAIHLLRHM
jgi:hypothetical protein